MKIAIIGAGIAGLTAARKLMDRGIAVDVFEKSRGLGGRLATKRSDWGIMDIGAQYFTARDQRFQQQVNEWQDDNIVACWDFIPSKLTPSGLTSSADKITRYVGIPKMNSPAHGLAQGIEIACETHIGRLEHSENGWSLIATNGKAIEKNYDWVVLSLPAEQSKLLTIRTAIYHQIPDRIHQPCWAAALATQGYVPANIQGIFGDDTISWVSRLSSRPNRETPTTYNDLWMLHFSSHWSATNGKNTEIDVAQTGFEWLSAAFKGHIKKPLQLIHAHKHYWRYASVQSDYPSSSIIADRASGIAAIGAWSAGGRVEGAYISALDFVDYFFEVK